MLFGETKPRPAKMTVPEYRQYLAGNKLLEAPAPVPLFAPEVYQLQPIPAPEGRQPQPQPQTVTLLLTPRPAERPRFSKFGGAYNSKNYSEYKKKLEMYEGMMQGARDIIAQYEYSSY